MNSNTVFIVVRDNGFICKKADHPSLIFKFEDLENRPNVPFYHLIWNDIPRYMKEFKDFYRNELINSPILSGFKKSYVHLAIPDDALEVDRKIIQEFLLLSGTKTGVFIPECMLLSREYETYVAVSRTCRMIVLSYIKAGNLVHQSYLENKDYSSDELKSHISKLLNFWGQGNEPIFLNGEKMEPYKPLGTLVDPDSMLESYIYFVDNNKEIAKLLKK